MPSVTGPLAVKLTPDPVAVNDPAAMESGPFSVELPAVTVNAPLRKKGPTSELSTNTPVNDWVAIHTKQAAYRTYVVGLRVPKGSVMKATNFSGPKHGAVMSITVDELERLTRYFSDKQN